MNAAETEEAVSARADEPFDPGEFPRWRREARLTWIWRIRTALTVLLATSGVGCAAKKEPDIVPEPEPVDPIPEAIRLSGSEQYPGQNGLVQKVGTGDLDGKLVILDAPVDGYHAQAVRKVVLDAGVPEEYVSIQENTRIIWDDGTLTVPEDTKVIVRSDFPPLRRYENGELLAKHNIIAAFPAGNVDIVEGHEHDRDWYRPDHPVWNKFPEAADYNSAMEGLRNANGKALLATWAEALTDGSIVPVQKAAMCGDAMEWCFAVRVPPNLLSFVREHGATSSAAPILGAHTFYLFQLWDTTEEVFGVLKECAFDAGEPGVDREFGLGIPTAICPTIQNREAQAASGSLSVGGGSAVVSSLLAGPGSSLSFGNRMNLSYSPSWKLPDLFVSLSSLAAGKTVSVGGKTLISALVGAGYAPLGVSSSMTRPGASLFAEAGMSRELLAVRNTSFALLAAFGAEAGSVSTLTGRAGAVLRYRSFSLYGGAVRTTASVAIPGHKAVGVPPTAVSRSGWEIALSRSFSFGRKNGSRPN